jgi:anti-anti-sigma factor
VLNFDIAEETEGRSSLLAVRGDFDIQVAERVAGELDRLEAAEPELLVLDLSRLSFLDSTGMAVIAAAHARAAAAGRRFAIVAPPAGVVRAFQISGLADLVPMVKDRDEVFPGR